ncbi:glycine zipper domain-containing protein [Novosphingobium beihaiensis]|uniref:Glycine zipper domain-containing protein n=1 Tax=Novosphingobium beihaiensis TaxID=2930389 RepID=A0ABT0BMX8_9SPHN|nr:glycine zipper domain-containing protein [Novosphingobium beihaiensis]MCJ2186338.1 glycine zipper domain-containing protein [Novosphingobium beihaiensis]
MRRLILPILAAGAFTMAACTSNYAGEGALAGGALGAGVGAATGGDAGTGAAIGAAAGAVAGSQVKKKDKDGCYRYDRHGNRYWDRDC